MLDVRSIEHAMWVLFTDSMNFLDPRNVPQEHNRRLDVREDAPGTHSVDDALISGKIEGAHLTYIILRKFATISSFHSNIRNLTTDR